MDFYVINQLIGVTLTRAWLCDLTSSVVWRDMLRATLTQITSLEVLVVLGQTVVKHLHLPSIYVKIHSKNYSPICH